MSPLVEAILGALLRHALAALGAVLVAHHWLTDSQVQDAQEQLTAYLLAHAEIYGPIVVALAWSLWSKYRQRLLTIAAAELPPGASDAQIALKAGTPAVKSMVAKTLAILLAAALGAGVATSTSSCASSGTLTPIGQVAKAADQVEQSGLAILHAAQAASQQINPLTGKPVISTAQLDQVAIVCDKVGRIGTSLAQALNDYNAAKASGGDTSKLSAAIQSLVADATSALQTIGTVIPPGIVQQVDQAVTSALGLYGQIKAAAL